MKNGISIIVPVYNEDKNVNYAYITISKVFEGLNYEIIFVDDGSLSSDTVDNLNKVVTKPLCKVIRNLKNIGQQGSIYKGMKAAKYNYIGVLDCDMQDNPTYLKQMYQKLLTDRKNNKEYDAIIGRRINRNDKWYKITTANLYYTLLNKVSRKNIANAGDFYCIKARYVNIINPIFLRGSIQEKLNCTYLDYARDARKYGKTKYTLYKMLKLSICGIYNSIKNRMEEKK